jgi:hypothetical protein
LLEPSIYSPHLSLAYAATQAGRSFDMEDVMPSNYPTLGIYTCYFGTRGGRV